MLRHNLLLIYRGFKRFKATFFINLIGLSTGLTCVLLIYFWVKDELEMDKFHEKENRLYRVMANNPNSEEIETSPSTQAILAQALIEEVPEIENAVASTGAAVELTMTFGDQHIPASTFFADKDFFTIFSFDLVHGNRNQLLNDKKGIAISESIAVALFNSADNAVGKTIEQDMERGRKFCQADRTIARKQTWRDVFR